MPEVLTSVDGEAILCRSWMPESEADYCFQQLLTTMPWVSETYTLFGKAVPAPRLICWMGDADAAYQYSGIEHVPVPWLPLVAQLRERVERVANARFNSVLGNLYRDGNDSVGWHSDNEKELGQNPIIASLSLGESRVFKMRHKKNADGIDVELTAGSLLIMRGPFQHLWKHCLPKTKTPKNPRINLTFRYVRNCL